MRKARHAVDDAIRDGATFAQVFDGVLRERVWRAAQCAVGLQMGFFAFLKPGPPPRRLFYQTGEAAKNAGRQFVLPFYRVDSANSLIPLDDSAQNGPNPHLVPAVLCECFHASRMVEMAVRADETNVGTDDRDPRFAHDLLRLLPRKARWPTTRLSPMELSLPAIVAPDGEMTACVAGWLLRRLQNRDLLAAIRAGDTKSWPAPGSALALDATQEAVKAWQDGDPANQALLHGLYDDRSPLNAPLLSHLDWATRIGLLAEGIPTRRMVNLLNWIIDYGAFIMGVRDGEQDSAHNPGHFAPPGEGTPVVEREARRRWALFSTDAYAARAEFLQASLRSICAGRITQPRVEELLVRLAALLVSTDETLSQFSERIRFAAAPHALMRLAEPSARAWVVLPVVRTSGPQDSQQLQHAGFFLGTFSPFSPNGPIADAGAAPSCAYDAAVQVCGIRKLLDPLARWLADTFFDAAVHGHAEVGYRRGALFAAMDHDIRHIDASRSVLDHLTPPAGMSSTLAELRTTLATVCNTVLFANKVFHGSSHDGLTTIGAMVRVLLERFPEEDRSVVDVTDAELPDHLHSDPELVILTGMILENAIKYSAPNTRVTVVSQVTNNAWTMAVCNTKGSLRPGRKSFQLGKGVMLNIASVRRWNLELPDKVPPAPSEGQAWTVRLTVPSHHIVRVGGTRT